MAANESGSRKNTITLKSVFNWPLDNIILSKNGTDGYAFYKHTVYSPVFEMDSEKVSWMFRLRINHVNWLMNIALRSAEVEPVAATYKIHLVKDGKRLKHYRETRGQFHVVRKEGKFPNQGFDWCVTPNKFHSLILPFDNNIKLDVPICNLSLVCDIEAKVPKIFQDIPVAVNKHVIENNNDGFLKEVFFFDITIIVKGKKFLAHKAILSERSSVFKSMFQNNTAESNVYFCGSMNQMCIFDIEPEVFKVLLRYIYTGKLIMEVKSAVPVLHIAERYKLAELKSACERYLIEHLTVANAIETFQVADSSSAASILHIVEKYELTELKSAYERYLIGHLTVENAIETLQIASSCSSSKFKKVILEYINKYAAEISNTKKWDEMLSTRPDLTKECFNVLIAMRKMD